MIKKHIELRLCGPSNTITTCNLLFTHNDNTNKTIIKIGRGWVQFLDANNIYPNHILEFKCDSTMTINVIVLSYDESSRQLFSN